MTVASLPGGELKWAARFLRRRAIRRGDLGGSGTRRVRAAALEWSQKARPGLDRWAEFIATFGLLAIVLVLRQLRGPSPRSRPTPLARTEPPFDPFVIRCTVARALTNTFTGIARGDVPVFCSPKALVVVVAIPLFA